MSELINNRQQRIDIMKGLIRQLHLGTAEDKIKWELETMLDSADYSDVFLMEVQLIQEGVPPESIRQLCDSHTRVLKKHLDLQETPQTVPGHPVHTFIAENQAIVRTCREIRSILDQIRPLDDQDDATSLVRSCQAQLNSLMDVDKHYRRKENLLFPYFEKKDMPGPPAVMWGKHDEIRNLLKTTIDGLQQIGTITASEARAFGQLVIDGLLESIGDMVYKEEKILLPTSLDLLTEQDWYEIYVQSDEIGYCLFAPEFEWIPEGGIHREIRKISAQSDRIQMPTGSFNLDELIAAFSVMPFDLTFVDRDDTVRYFTPGKERIFDRSRAVLGRKVQYCHPPKSVHIVNKILADFKNGSQDKAQFWIRMGKRFIHIVYYAVRDQDGSYLGTLEVTQDITGIKKLEGEQRLLNYEN